MNESIHKIALDLAHHGIYIEEDFFIRKTHDVEPHVLEVSLPAGIIFLLLSF